MGISLNAAHEYFILIYWDMYTDEL